MKKSKYIFVCLIAGILNYGLCWFIQQVLALPLFFDTVMVMAVLFVYGLYTALGTLSVHFLLGVIWDLAHHFNNTFLYLYMFSGFAIVLVTWLFIRKMDMAEKNPNYIFLKIISASIIAASASCVTGGLVNYLIMTKLNPGDIWFGQSMIMSVLGIWVPLLPSLIIGRIPLTFLDRIITTFLGFEIALLYKKIIKSKSLIYEE